MTRNKKVIKTKIPCIIKICWLLKLSKIRWYIKTELSTMIPITRSKFRILFLSKSISFKLIDTSSKNKLLIVSLINQSFF